MLKSAQLPKPRDLAVVREDEGFVIVNDGIDNRIAMRKPLSDRWIERRNAAGILISLSLKMPGFSNE